MRPSCSCSNCLLLCSLSGSCSQRTASCRLRLHIMTQSHRIARSACCHAQPAVLANAAICSSVNPSASPGDSSLKPPLSNVGRWNPSAALSRGCPEAAMAAAAAWILGRCQTQKHTLARMRRHGARQRRQCDNRRGSELATALPVSLPQQQWQRQRQHQRPQLAPQTS